MQGILGNRSKVRLSKMAKPPYYYCDTRYVAYFCLTLLAWWADKPVLGGFPVKYVIYHTIVQRMKGSMGLVMISV